MSPPTEEGEDQVKSTKKKKSKLWAEGEHRVALNVIEPNDWNMNRMEPIMYEKTKLVIQETLEEAGRIPPIVCMNHPSKPGWLLIIDGYHRWKIVGELDYVEIDVCVLNVSLKRAMSMTSELNYNRGEKDAEKYPVYLARMMREHGVDAEWLGARGSDSPDEIKQYLAAANLEIEVITIPEDSDVDTKSIDASEADALMELKFTCRQGAVEVIERELARLGKTLGGGKNTRGRALEAMAVLSSQTPLTSITGEVMKEEDDEPASKKMDVGVGLPGKKKQKDKLKARARA